MPRTKSATVEAIETEFDVDRDRCRQDVLAVLEQLISARLLKTEDAPSA